MEQQVLRSLLTDLKKVRQVCTEENLKEVPEVCVDYIWANRDALEFFLGEVLNKMNKTQREKLLKQHSELDGSVLSDDFLPIASSALRSAAERKKSQVGKAFSRVDEDDVHMLVRALEYAKYCGSDGHQFKVMLSPIEDHGLRRKFGNFIQLTSEEFNEISWHISDILYDSEKSRALAKCQEIGLNLQTKEATLNGRYYPDWKQEWSVVLLELLKYKAECDWAVVFQKVPTKRSKYVNTIDRKLESESADLVYNVRQALQDFFSVFKTASSNPSDYADVESELQDFKRAYADLRSGIATTQPRPSLFSEVSKLENNMAQKPVQTVGSAPLIRPWFAVAGYATGLLTLLFFMALVVAGIIGHEVPQNTRMLVVFVISLGLALASSFIGGNAAANGSVPFPFAKERPIAFTVGGGIAVFVVALLVGYYAYAKT